jgi:uncharacterized membrane protein
MNEPANRHPVMQRVEILISWILRGGVIVSMATVLVGLGLMFTHHPDYFRSTADLQRLTSPGAAFPHTPAEVLRGVATGRGQAIVTLGLLLLIATPILRVAISLVGFVLERDRVYALISAAVLIFLMIAFLLGKVE